MRKWTEPQNDAINARGGNIIVSAAAGSGKTAVLVERVVRLITDEKNPVDIDKLLIVTFTIPAAAEMKARISSRLEEILKENPQNRRIMRQLTLIPSAKICTIDAFCLNLVRENFFELSVSQDFTILDNSEAGILSDNAINTVLDEFYEENDPDFIKLVESLSSPKDETGLISAIKDTYNYISAQPVPLAWLSKMIESYRPGVAFEDSIWYKSALDYASEMLKYALEISDECLSFINNEDSCAEYYSEFLGAENNMCRKLVDTLDSGWNALIDELSKTSFGTFYSKKKSFEVPDYKDEVVARRNFYKDIINSVKEEVTIPYEKFEEDNAALYPILRMLYKVVERFSQEYLKLKNERNAYTFSDIEHFALNLLMDTDENGNIVKSAAAKDLQSSFCEILVDEYQDTNEAQDTLFSLLSNGSNRFMVGDVKQSIYKFRLAMPYIFNSKKETYKDYDKENPLGDARIILDKNFRSRKDICGFTNFVFSEFMSEKAGELDYNEREYLNCGAEYPKRDKPCIYLKITDGCKSADIDESEAVQIAKIIKEKIDSHETVSDGGKERNITYGDFAILLRNSKKHIDNYERVLTSCGIPTVSESNSDLLECSEIKMLLSLLRVVDNPSRDIPLLAVMMSPLYGFTADELTEIKLENGGTKRSLYSSVVSSKSQKCIDFIKEIQMFSETAVTMSISSFIRYICEYKSVYAFVNALGNGGQRSANINTFIAFAQNFDASSGVGLTSFLRLVDGIAESGEGIKAAELSAGGENAVKIMSIHHSKGLEFPVVILAGTSRRYNYSDLNNSLIFNEKYGISLKRHNEEKLYRTETLQNKIMKNINKTAALSENLRVLYVAVTRAKEQFIAMLSHSNLQKRITSDSVKIKSGSIEPCICRGISNDADFLLCAALLHRDGIKLRNLSPIEINTCHSGFDIDIDIVDLQKEDTIIPVEEAAEPDDEIIRLIASRVNYKYEGIANRNVCAKLNASELDKNASDIEYFALSKPAFMNEGGLTPGQKGTAMHTFMQFCDYKAARDDLESEITRIKSLGYISDVQAQSLSRKELSDFFGCDFAKRMFSADNIYREIKISSFVNADEIFDTESKEQVLVRGISDCVFEENGELVLVDYKTDRVKTEEELLGRYKNQIAFYRKVIEKTLQKPVKKAVLYSFYLSKVCEYR